jgi:hypothetical protein
MPMTPTQLWVKACDYDNISPSAEYINFSRDNPWIKKFYQDRVKEGTWSKDFPNSPAVKAYVRKKLGINIDVGDVIKSKAGYSPANIINKLTKDPEFRSMDINEQILVASVVQRKPYSGKYIPTDFIKQNKKQDSSKIYGVDTIRGCDNYCLSCYANKLISLNKINFSEPVKAKVLRNLKEDKYLRVGMAGDPAFDWKWTVDQIKDVMKRSPKATPEKIVYVTKLQKIEGFDPSVIKNMQVSVDPLNREHMETTMKNVEKLKKKDPNLNIILRIRSYDSNRKDLQKSLQDAVDFANKNKLPVLETKMRGDGAFLELLDLDKSSYHKTATQFKANHNFLSGKIDKSRYLECDPFLKGCKTCNNCAKTIKVAMPYKQLPTAKMHGKWAKKKHATSKVSRVR